MKGVGLWDKGKYAIRTRLYQHPSKAKMALFSLKGVGLWDERCKLY